MSMSQSQCSRGRAHVRELSKGTAILCSARVGMLQAWREPSSRALFALSGVTPGEREELTFRRLRDAARYAVILRQS